MQNIIIGFSKPKSWKPLAWLIMIGYGIPFSHVYIKFWSESLQRYIIYQASGTALNFMGKEIFDSHNNIVIEFEVPISIENRTKMVQYCIDNSGKPYGKLNALGLAIIRIAELFGYKIKNPFSDGKKTEVCCELGAYVLNDFADIKIDNIDELNPKQLFEILKNRGLKEITYGNDG